MLQREWVGKGIETLNKLLQHVEAQARGERHAYIEIMSLQPLEWIDNSKGISSPDCNCTGSDYSHRMGGFRALVWENDRSCLQTLWRLGEQQHSTSLKWPPDSFVKDMTPRCPGLSGPYTTKLHHYILNFLTLGFGCQWLWFISCCLWPGTGCHEQLPKEWENAGICHSMELFLEMKRTVIKRSRGGGAVGSMHHKKCNGLMPKQTGYNPGVSAELRHKYQGGTKETAFLFL